jgi:phosphoglucomutase
MSSAIKVIKTTPYADQKPGTSGLRKKVKIFKQKYYVENFVQSCFNAISSEIKQGGTFVVGGDGRFLMMEVLHKIISVGAAANVKKFIIGVNGLLSTPCVSGLIRKFKADGGFVLTASHNPGGESKDFGIKYNCSNGGPALECLTDKIYQFSKSITEFKWVELPTLDLHKPTTFSLFADCLVQVVDGVSLYSELMKEIFNFTSISKLLQEKNFKIKIDCMNGVTGPFAKNIFINELEAPEDSVINFTPLPDFGGLHPDPNLTYAKNLVDLMAHGKHDFGAAFDGDGDRNMILGRDVFVNPSDSVAIIAANYACIPHFRAGLKGVARSMPTSGALDSVARKFGINLFETPTGWKYFVNLMEAGRLSICGEESFGQGSDHVREKDGIWAVLGKDFLCKACSCCAGYTSHPIQRGYLLLPLQRKQ